MFRQFPNDPVRRLNRWVMPSTVALLCLITLFYPTAPTADQISPTIAETQSGLLPHLAHKTDKLKRRVQWGPCGTFIALGNTTLFVEGLTHDAYRQLFSQVIWGGLVPGLLLGTRPFVRALLTHLGSVLPSSPTAVYSFQTIAGHSLAILGQLANLENIINAGGVYTGFSAVFALLNYKTVLTSLGLQGLPYGIREIFRLCLTSYTLTYASLLERCFQVTTHHQIHLPGLLGRHFFINIDAPPSLDNVAAITIYRTGLGELEPELGNHPLARLARIMDKTHANKLSLLVQTTAAGNTLSLAIDRDTRYHGNPIVIDLDYDKATTFTPWLEAELLASEGLEPGSYLSVFEENTLNHIIDAVGCIEGSDNSCFQGTMDNNNNSHPVYRPHQTRLKAVSITDQQNSPELKLKLGNQLYMRPASWYTILSPSPNIPLQYEQIWIPSWLTSLFVAELTAKARNTLIDSLHNELYSAASHLGINTAAPTMIRGTTTVLSGEPANSTHGNNQDMTGSRAVPGHSTAWPRPEWQQLQGGNRAWSSEDTSQTTSSSSSSSTLPLNSSSDWSTDSDTWLTTGLASSPQNQPETVPQASSGPTSERIRESAGENNPGTVTTSQIRRPRRSPQDRPERFIPGNPHPQARNPNGILAPQILKPYAVGVVSTMEQISQDDAACVICFEGATKNRPLYWCPHKCKDGIAHLDCLDQYAFHYLSQFHNRRKLVTYIGSHQAQHPHNTSTPCPVCRQPITTAIRWLDHHRD